MGGRGAAAAGTHRAAQVQAAVAAANRIPTSGPFTTQRLDSAFRDAGVDPRRLLNLPPEQVRRAILISAALSGGIAAVGSAVLVAQELRHQREMDWLERATNAVANPRRIADLMPRPGESVYNWGIRIRPWLDEVRSLTPRQNAINRIWNAARGSTNQPWPAIRGLVFALRLAPRPPALPPHPEIDYGGRGIPRLPGEPGA